MNEKIKVKNIVLRCGADSLLPLMLVYMLYIILHGHLSPGGGFQGGVLMVAVVTILYLGHGYATTANAISGTRKRSIFSAKMYHRLDSSCPASRSTTLPPLEARSHAAGEATMISTPSTTAVMIARV